MIKIFGYVRESTMQQAVHGYNIEEQKRVIENYCKYNYEDYELYVYMEKGKSATTMNRPELQHLLDTVKKAKASIVIFHSIDRLTRDLGDLIWLVQFFDKNKIELVSVMESMDMSTAIGRSHVYNSGVYAQLESERTSERTIRALKQGVLEGKYPFANSPLGYEKIDKRLYPTTNKKELSIVKFIFTSITENKYSYTELQAKLKEKYDFTINWETIPDIITNKVYIGIKEYREIVNENFCVPIVSEQLFLKANENAKHRKSRGSKKCNYLFQNIVYCEQCNAFFKQKCGTSRNKSRYVYYVCEKCGAYISQNKLIDECFPDLQELCRKYKLDQQNYYENKATLEKYRKNMQILVDKHKKGIINQQDFWDIYQNYTENIDLLKEKIEKMSVKNISFKKIGICNQKEIIRKYVDRVVISNYKKKNRMFSAQIIFDDNYE